MKVAVDLHNVCVIEALCVLGFCINEVILYYVKVNTSA